VVPADAPMPRLPVARSVWVPRPNLEIGAACWIHGGGAHHTGFSQALTREHLEDFAEMAGIECLMIGAGATVYAFKQELRWNEVYHALRSGLNG